MEIICLQTEAFYKLIDTVLERTQPKSEPFKWIGTADAMLLLQIRSKTTLQQLRDNGEVRFSQPQRKIILYDRDSILDYLERNAKDTF